MLLFVCPPISVTLKTALLWLLGLAELIRVAKQVRPRPFWMNVLEPMVRGMLAAFRSFLLQLFLGTDLIQPWVETGRCGFTSPSTVPNLQVVCSRRHTMVAPWRCRTQVCRGLDKLRAEGQSDIWGIMRGAESVRLVELKLGLLGGGEVGRCDYGDAIWCGHGCCLVRAMRLILDTLNVRGL